MNEPEINDGGPAFPGIATTFTGIDSDGEERYENAPAGGMTLRDYFAAKAMQAALSNPLMKTAVREFVNEVADTSFVVADAMIRARSAR